MRLGKITEERVLNRDDDGKLYPKKEWGYTVHAIVNGYSIYAPDDSRYDAYKGCYEAAKWASEQQSHNCIDSPKLTIEEQEECYAATQI